MSRPRPRRRVAALGLALVGLAGLGLASAAQLSVGASSVGAGSAAVESCQPAAQPVDVSFSNGFASGAYTITGVTVGNIHGDCIGKTLQLRLVGSTGTPVGAELTWAVSSGGHTWNLSGPQVVAAGGVARAVVVIHG